MDKLKNYLKPMSKADRISFALRCGTTWPYLRNVSYGQRVPGEKLCTRIEYESGRAVTRPDLRPDDWWEVWPELRATTQEAEHV